MAWRSIVLWNRYGAFRTEGRQYMKIVAATGGGALRTENRCAHGHKKTLSQEMRYSDVWRQSNYSGPQVQKKRIEEKVW